MILFQYDPALLDQYPTICGGVIDARGLTNGPTPPALAEAFAEEQARTLDRIGDTPLSEIESLSAWRRAFSQFGVKPTQYRSAAEALLRRLTKKGDIPTLNLLVDLGNLVSIRYGLPVAVFDWRTAAPPVTVRFARGDERFTPLGESGLEHPEPGEVIFVDAADLVSARRWCWRQSGPSAAGPATRDALITVEAHHASGPDDVRAAVDDLLTLLNAYQPGATFIPAILTPANPVFMA